MQTRNRSAKARAAATRVDWGARRALVVRQLHTGRPPARSALGRGSVVWASIPFLDDPTVAKTRPAVVTAVAGRTVTLLPLTSSCRDAVRLSDQYVRLEDWAAAGLTRPCRAWRREVTVDRMDVTLRVGELTPADRSRLLGGDRPQAA